MIFAPSLVSLVFAALAVAVPHTGKRATCSGGQTTANEAVSSQPSVVPSDDSNGRLRSAVSGSTSSTTSSRTC